MIGVGGYAQAHLSVLMSLQATGFCHLVAVADPFAHQHQELVHAMQASGTQLFTHQEELLAQTDLSLKATLLANSFKWLLLPSGE